MSFVNSFLWDLLTDEDGQALAETSLVLAFIALVCILALTAIGLAVSGSLNDFAAAFGIGDAPPPVVVNN